MAWTQYKQLIIACIIGGIIGIICSLFFNNILWVPLLIMVAGLVSLFCKPASPVPPEEDIKSSNQEPTKVTSKHFSQNKLKSSER